MAPVLLSTSRTWREHSQAFFLSNAAFPYLPASFPLARPAKFNLPLPLTNNHPTSTVLLFVCDLRIDKTFSSLLPSASFLHFFSVYPPA
ncbi:hypothetical protein FJTKL_07961 [Diaporthe vaccinii]|uniref:Uncharacterized protein n=1 Tax=Diaporthe vaccinii TaxID=105482 RepID=A0ABR4FE08_9PEZI